MQGLVYNNGHGSIARNPEPYHVLLCAETGYIFKIQNFATQRTHIKQKMNENFIYIKGLEHLGVRELKKPILITKASGYGLKLSRKAAVGISPLELQYPRAPGVPEALGCGACAVLA